MAAAAMVQGSKYEVTHTEAEDLFPKLA